MERSFFEDDEDEKRHQLAQDYFAKGETIKALGIIEDSILIHGKHKVPSNLRFLQGNIFRDLAERMLNSNLKFVFLLGSVECFSEGYEVLAAVSLFELAEHIGSALYYSKALRMAKVSLSLMASSDPMTSYEQATQKKLENLVQEAESRMLFCLTVKESDLKLGDLKETRVNRRKDSQTVAFERLRSYWESMNAESKRNFMKISTAEFSRYVERLYGKEGQDALEEVLDSAKKNKKWKFWMCRTCSQKFFYPKKFKNHLEQVHSAKFKTNKENLAERVDDVWAGMILVARWEPVDAVAAAEMIKNRLEFVKEFVYMNGWSKDWPLAADEERRTFLKNIQLLLVLFWERRILSCSIRDWMMQFVVKHLAQFEVSEYTLTTDRRLVETPQSICFLECPELNQILDILKRIKCERADDTELVSNATDSLWPRIQVKEKIEFDHEFSYILLDKRLLRGKIATFDDEGSINVCDHNVHYAKTHPQGDDIITWLFDYPLIDNKFAFPRSIRAYNLDIWVAVMNAIHLTRSNLVPKCAKKWQIQCYDTSLNYAMNVCIREDERRKHVPKDQWKIYASLLFEKCEEDLTVDVGDPLVTKTLFSAVRDVLVGALHPAFDFPDLEDCLTLIHEHRNISDDKVLKSIDLLKSVVTNKLPLADSKILLVENSRISLLNDLMRLSVLDYRVYILHLLKRFLREKLDGIVDMAAKAKIAIVQAELLSEEKQEKEKNSRSKKKKCKRNKKTSTSMSSLLDQNVKHESSVNLELGGTSLKTVEEDFMEPENTLSNEKGRPLEKTSCNTNNQEETFKDSLSEHLELAHREAATSYRSALDVTLKALLNIKVLQEDLVQNRQPFHGNLEENVHYALQDFFSAFVSEQITEEGLYSYLLSNLIASLEEVQSMSSDAAEVVVAILEFFHCWKSPERESLVTRLFTLEEYERMNCRKCRSKPNYPEKSSYGIVMAADSIRDLKCTFGNLKFGDILKMIRMEDKMLCDIKTGGCGMTHFVHHTISRCPPIFTIVLEWDKKNTDKEISETTKALDWEIDISRLFDGLEPKTKYRLVSMIGCGEEGKYICMAYKKNRWVSHRHEALAEEGVGNWKNVVKLCGERKVRPEILFYEPFRSVA